MRREASLSQIPFLLWRADTALADPCAVFTTKSLMGLVLAENRKI
jgi:hypothetical protein